MDLIYKRVFSKACDRCCQLQNVLGMRSQQTHCCVSTHNNL